MMESNRFMRLVEIILEHEGGYVDDPDDRGGETKFGISKRSYPDLDIKTLTKTQARTIYHMDYWSRHYDDILSDRLALMLFDFGVNAGTNRAVRILQHVVGSPTDGIPGPYTVRAVNDYHQHRLARDYGVSLAMYYFRLNQDVFIRGWLKRLMDNMTRII